MKWPKRTRGVRGKAEAPAPSPPTGTLSPEGYRFSNALVMLAPAAQRPPSIALLGDEVVERHLRYGRRALAVCGATERTGVSFIAANLAIALSQHGVSALLVDANVRRPSLQSLITPPHETPGLRDYLMNPDMDLAEIVHPDVIPRLSVIFAGGAASEAAGELIATEPFRRFVAACLRAYECTIFDAPPANRSADARMIGVAAGYVLLVARRGASFVDDLSLLTQQLEQDGVSVVGSIFNGA